MPTFAAIQRLRFAIAKDVADSIVAVVSSPASVNATNLNAKRSIVAAAKFSSKGDSNCHPPVIQTLIVATVVVMVAAVVGIMVMVTLEVVVDMTGTVTEEMEATTTTSANITEGVVERVVIDGKMIAMEIGEEEKGKIEEQKGGEGNKIVAFR